MVTQIQGLTPKNSEPKPKSYGNGNTIMEQSEGESDQETERKIEEIQEFADDEDEDPFKQV